MEKVWKIIIFSCVIAYLPLSASAATLGFSRGGTYKVGSTFSVTLYVSSADQPMNAASGTISFSKNTIEAISASRSGSIFSFWAKEPSVSNTSGTVSFAGIVPSPGYKGSGGKILTISFRAKAPGTARVSLSAGSVLANDGNGTNIYTGGGSSSFTIAAADPKPKPQEPEKPAEPATPQTPVSPTVTPELPAVEPTALAAPIITFYPEEAVIASPIKIRGTGAANSGVSVRIKQGDSIVASEQTVSDDTGSFLVLVSKRLEPGTYTFTAQVSNPQGQQSPESSPLGFIVTPKPPVDTTSLILQYLTLIILGLLALIGAIAIAMYLRHWLRLLLRKHEAKLLVHSLGTMRKHIDAYITDSKASKDTHKVSPANLRFLEQFAKTSVDAEKIIITDLEKPSAPPAKKTVKKKPIKKKRVA